MRGDFKWILVGIISFFWAALASASPWTCPEALSWNEVLQQQHALLRQLARAQFFSGQSQTVISQEQGFDQAALDTVAAMNSEVEVIVHPTILVSGPRGQRQWPVQVDFLVRRVSQAGFGAGLSSKSDLWDVVDLRAMRSLRRKNAQDQETALIQEKLYQTFHDVKQLRDHGLRIQSVQLIYLNRDFRFGDDESTRFRREDVTLAWRDLVGNDQSEIDGIERRMAELREELSDEGTLTDRRWKIAEQLEDLNRQLERVFLRSDYYSKWLRKRRMEREFQELLDEQDPAAVDPRSVVYLPADWIKRGTSRKELFLEWNIQDFSDLMSFIPQGELKVEHEQIRFEFRNAKWRDAARYLSDHPNEDFVLFPGVLKARLEQLFPKGQPVISMDFETLADPVPRFPQSAPNDDQPFQFSIQVNDEQPIAYLAPNQGDHRRSFIEAMLAALPEAGNIWVVHRSKEDGVLERLARDFPEYAHQIQGIRGRLKDWIKLSKESFYHVEQRGSYGLKALTRAILKEPYEADAVQGGLQASALFVWSNDPRRTVKERHEARQQLLAYCFKDTNSPLKMIHWAFKQVGQPAPFRTAQEPDWSKHSMAK